MYFIQFVGKAAQQVRTAGLSRRRDLTRIQSVRSSDESYCRGKGPDSGAYCRSRGARARFLREAQTTGSLNYDNIIRGIIDRSGRVRLLDFGIAKQPNRNITQPSAPYYMAPEQVRDEEATLLADVYSFWHPAVCVAFGHEGRSTVREPSRSSTAY